MPSHWQDAYIEVDGLQFHYTRTGVGRKQPLLLLHGFSDNGLCWLPLARDLETEYDVIMPDARGHGLSARVQLDKPIDNTADAAGLIKALGLPQPVVAGHSMGGLTATELGARYPDLIGGLILEDPAWINPSPDEVPPQENPFFAWLLNLERVSLDEIIVQGKAENPAWSEVEFPAWAESKRQLDKTILNAINMRRPWREYVAELTVPALLITAETEMGAIVSPAVAREAASLSPLLQVAAVPYAGHNIRRENYPVFLQAVKKFLTSVR